MIGKPKPNGMREVFVYDPTIKRKRYVGRRPTLREAQLLEAEKTIEHAAGHRPGSAWTIDTLADKFLTEYHGPGTTRPAPTTLVHNTQNLRRIRAEHGHRPAASLTRDEAYAWARAHRHEAKTLAAMYNEAVDKHLVDANPFAKLGLARGRGRADITPLTEQEVERLAEIALRTLGHYGPEYWALILWQAWTGMRPGETCALRVADIDWQAATAAVARNARNDGTLGPIKGNQNRTINIADVALQAAETLHRTSGRLFRTPTGKPLRPNSLRHYWITVRAAFTAELPDTHWLRRRLMIDPADQLDPYELRHFCGSLLADRGLPAKDISEHLGNSPRVCEDTYIHTHRDRVNTRLREALNRPTTTAGDTSGQAQGQAPA